MDIIAKPKDNNNKLNQLFLMLNPESATHRDKNKTISKEIILDTALYTAIFARSEILALKNKLNTSGNADLTDNI